MRPPSAKVAETVSEFCGQLGVIEVLDPFRITLDVSSLECSYGLRQGHIARTRISEPSEGACFHGVEMRGKGGRRQSLSSTPGGSRKVGSFVESPDECGLMAHGVEDAGG
jgi:hypothetical protein